MAGTAQATAVIAGKHVKQGTRRRIAYDAWYERVGEQLIITAALRYGDRVLATLDLDVAYRAALGTEEIAVAAAIARYIDEASFDFGADPAAYAAHPAVPVQSARSEWADLRGSDWGR